MADLLLPIKVVPGASRDQISGMLADRIKVRISAPAEGGKANRAVCGLIARSLGIKKAGVEVVSGKTNPEKTVRISGSNYVTPEGVIVHLLSS